MSASARAQDGTTLPTGHTETVTIWWSPGGWAARARERPVRVEVMGTVRNKTLPAVFSVQGILMPMDLPSGKAAEARGLLTAIETALAQQMGMRAVGITFEKVGTRLPLP